jgi:hypothetical protein
MGKIPYKTACTNVLPDDEHVMKHVEGTENSIKILI